jgi:hypothetical protein
MRLRYVLQTSFRQNVRYKGYFAMIPGMIVLANHDLLFFAQNLYYILAAALLRNRLCATQPV